MKHKISPSPFPSPRLHKLPFTFNLNFHSEEILPFGHMPARRVESS